MTLFSARWRSIFFDIKFLAYFAANAPSPLPRLCLYLSFRNALISHRNAPICEMPKMLTPTLYPDMLHTSSDATRKAHTVDGYKIKGETEYYRKVKSMIEQFGAGRGTFTPIELAQGINGKVTLSLRRALAQAEIDKKIEPFWFTTPSGGRAKAYMVCVELHQLPLEMPPF